MAKRELPESIDGILDDPTNLDFKYLRNLLYFSAVRDFQVLSNKEPHTFPRGRVTEREREDSLIQLRAYVCDELTTKNTWKRHAETRMVSIDNNIDLILNFITYRSIPGLSKKKDVTGFAIFWPTLVNVWPINVKNPSDFLAPIGLKLVGGEFEERDVTGHCSLETELIVPAEHNLWRHTREIGAYMAAPSQVPIGSYRMDFKPKFLPERLV